MMNTLFSKTIKTVFLTLTVSLIFIACETDFVNIESDIEGVKNFETLKASFPLLSYSKSYGEVQTSGLPSNLLGVYNNPLYGTTTASIVTQVSPTQQDPNFGEDPKIESVIITVPYFSTQVGETNDDGESEYKLDSVYGDLSISYKLSIYRNNYLLRDLDPNTNFEDPQAYYSNAIQELNLDTQQGQLFYQDPVFKPSNLEHIDNTDPDNIVITVPALKVKLDPLLNDTYWKTTLLDNQGLPPLSNTNNFKEFFRGLIFKVEANPNTIGNGSQIMLNFASGNANIVFNYTNGPEDARVDQTYVMTFSGVRLNPLETNYNFPLPDGDDVNGDDKLFIKGGVGSAGIINLFNGDTGDLDQNGNPITVEDYFKSKKDKWLINQANLTVYVDQSSITEDEEPERLVLYDLKNNVPIIDYFIDVATINNEDPNQSKILYAEPLETDANGQGKYKFRITDHLTNILLSDSTNVNLGVYVSTNVNLLLNGDGTTPYNSLTFGSTEDEDDTTLDAVPATTVLSPSGTVLHGSNENVPENLRVKLEIFYTEPQN